MGKDVAKVERELTALVGQNPDDLALLLEFRRTGSLLAVSEKLGLGGPQEAEKAIRKAAGRINKRAERMRGAMRAMELVNLVEIDRELGAAGGEVDGVHWADPKIAAEKRLLSESRRRLYGLDAKPESEVEAPQINVIFATPAEREAGVGGAPEEIDGELVEPPGLPAGGEADG